MTNSGSSFVGGLVGLVLLTCLAAPALGAAQVSLTGMEKQENPDRTKITLHFADLPEFAVDHSGQRIDLLLYRTRVSTQLRSLPEDETVIKILLAQKFDDLLASFLLRRSPVQVHAESRRDPARIELTLRWQEDQGSRPGLAFRITDMPPRKPGRHAKAYQQESPWEDRWLAFFREYHTDWNLQLPLEYSLPPLPALIDDLQDPLWRLQQYADAGQWLSLLQSASQLGALDSRQRQLRDLLTAEARLRSGATATGLAQLEGFDRLPAAEQQRVDYLTAYAQARGGQPYLAKVTLQERLAELGAAEPLAAQISLLAAELALITKEPERALEVLTKPDLSWPEDWASLVALRQADALAGLEQVEEALDLYAELEMVPGLFLAHPFSANRAARTAYRAQRYALAGKWYRPLAESWEGQPGGDLLTFAAGAASLKAGDREWGMIELEKTRLEYPGSEGGGRARLLLLDERVLGGERLHRAEAALDYGALKDASASRLVREEAAFKRGLTLYLLGEYRESVRELMDFRRQFSSSALRREADLLLREQLPLVMDQLQAAGDDLQAVVLVEQNRSLLLSGQLDRAFLKDLARAFTRLGLYQRASRVLLYLYDQAGSEGQREPVYLPLAQTYLKRERYRQAVDYAERYLKTHPTGEDAPALYAILLDALDRLGDQEQLRDWSSRPDRPSSPQLEMRAAWIHWRQQRLPQVIASLERARKQAGELPVKEMALLAEAYFQRQEDRAAAALYRQLQAEPQFATQAGYRSAQLLLRQAERARALNLLTRLVDEDGSSRWGKLARDLLIQENSREL